MKKIILINLLLIGILFSNMTFAQTKNNNAFNTHLTLMYEHYINLKQAFIKSDIVGVSTMAREIEREFLYVNEASSKLEDDKIWKIQSIKIKGSIKEILRSKDIRDQRASFAILSDALYQNIKTYGVLGMKSYYQYCPMALDGKGAYWLSLQEKISNPYFGDMMLTCGKTKEVIE